MPYSEDYKGFHINESGTPISTKMSPITISTDDEGLKHRLETYMKSKGQFAPPVGDLEMTVASAQKYIDAVLAETSH